MEANDLLWRAARDATFAVDRSEASKSSENTASGQSGEACGSAAADQPNPSQEPSGSTRSTADEEWREALGVLAGLCESVMNTDYSKLDLIEHTDMFERAQRSIAGLTVVIKQQKAWMERLRLELAVSRLQECSTEGPKILRFGSLEELGNFLADEAAANQ